MSIEIDENKCDPDTGERYVKFRCGPNAQSIEDFVDTDKWEVLETHTIPYPDFLNSKRNKKRVLEIQALIRRRIW